jgi:hypothetical protein
MSATATVANGQQERIEGSASARPASKKSRLRHTPGGVGLGKDASRDAQRLAAAILEVLAGVRTPGQAAEALGVSLPRYFQLETRAMHAVVASCEPRPRGPGRNADKELQALKRQHERVQRELARQQTLVRLAQRAIGLAPVQQGAPAASKGKLAAASGKPGASATGGKRRRRRRPVVRALRAAAQLQEQSKEAPAETPALQETKV